MESSSKPDFIAYNIQYYNMPSYWLCRKLYPVEKVCWTIRSARQLEKARNMCDVFIFDGFDPERSL